MTDHTACAQVIKNGMAPFEVTVSTLPPIVTTQFTARPFTCQHGVTLWIEPTGEEKARMAAEARSLGIEEDVTFPDSGKPNGLDTWDF